MCERTCLEQEMGMDDLVTADPGPAENRANIINSLWQNTTQISPEESHMWEAYFFYYTSECKTALSHYGEHATVRTHQDVIDIARKLQDGSAKGDIKQAIIFHEQQDAEVKKRMMEGSVRLVVRLISMIDVGSIPSHRIRSHAPLPWQDDQQNLRAALIDHFKAGTSAPKTSQFDRYFSAFNIRRFAGLEIQWTDNLADHLRLVDYDTKLCIFYHITFLRGQERYDIREASKHLN